jgi:UDP-glucose 4-epimerase
MLHSLPASGYGPDRRVALSGYYRGISSFALTGSCLWEGNGERRSRIPGDFTLLKSCGATFAAFGQGGILPGARILLAGGAGYIGSHMARALLDAGHAVTTLDDFSTGRRDAFAGETLVRGSIGDGVLVDALLENGRLDAVMHFAARSLVAESVAAPAAYWLNNVSGTLVLLDAMRRHGVDRFIFSSTAAVYGEPERTPIGEDHRCAPTNPYGESKLAVERMLGHFGAAYGLRATVLRYFNAAGAHPDGTLGEAHDPETHLVPLVLQCAAGTREAVSVFGADYRTPDGTCVRDYVHVCDLCDAHLGALERLLDGGEGATYNLGNSRGHSVREVIECARRVSGGAIPAVDAPRRPGDPAVLVADSRRAREALGWRPRYEALEDIVATAWRWHLHAARSAEASA